MEHRKIINLLENTPNESTRFKTKKLSRNKWWRITQRITPIVKLNLKLQCSNAYFLASGTITVPNIGTAANPKNRKNIIIISFPPFTDWIVEINGTQIDNANEIHIVMSIYNLI